MAEESINQIIKRISNRIIPDPNRPMYVALCILLDKLAVLELTYDPSDDTYDINYEDGRKEIRNILVTRKEIKNVNL